MRFYGAALSGGLILSSLSGAATQDTIIQTANDRVQPSLRRHSEVEAPVARKDSVFEVLKKFVPAVDIPLPFRLSNDQIPDQRRKAMRMAGFRNLLPTKTPRRHFWMINSYRLGLLRKR
jgi:hypothetical protein